MLRQRGVRCGAFTAGFAAVGALTWWLSDRRRRERARRRLRYESGRLVGLRYRLVGGHSAEDVTDDLLATRVRSALGATTKRLDLPHVHVSVARRIVFLHGVASTDAEADTVERAARRVPGVDGVLSYLHVGLAAGDTRPSEGSLAYAESAAMRRLVAAAEDTGLPERSARAAVRAVLATFLERLPASQRDHVLAHLPRDVQVLATPPRRHGHAPARMRHLHSFLEAVVAADHVEPARSRDVSSAVLRTLRELVPEESRQVAAVLPPELRELWLAVPTSHT